MIYNYKIGNGKREPVFEYINSKRKEGNFTVIDIGGTVEGWSSPIIDAIMDFQIPNKIKKEYKDEELLFFKADITNPNDWNEILSFVEKNGKFDFCICCHTLEDIMNPGFVCEQISKISKEGYIATPSKYNELAIHEAYYKIQSKHHLETKISYGHRGYMHHRWIFTIHNNTLIGFPKIGYLETNTIFDNIASIDENICDLSFFWKDSIEFEYLNNNYLGPTSKIVLLYNNLLEDEYL